MLRSPCTPRDVFTVICVLEHGDLDRVVADEHPLFQKRVFQGLFDWYLLYKHFDPLCGFSLLSCYQVLVWHHCYQVFTSC